MMEDDEVIELIKYCKQYQGQLKHLTPEYILKLFRENKG